MLSTKVCQLNNWIQDFLSLHAEGKKIYSSWLIHFVPAQLISISTSNRNLALTRLMQAGKIFGSGKSYTGRWYIEQLNEFDEIASMRQVAEVLGYKSSKPLYKHLKAGNLPIHMNKNGHQYFVLDEITNWAREQRILPFIRPRFSLEEIHEPLQQLIKYIRRLGISDTIARDTSNATGLEIKEIIDIDVFKGMESDLLDILDEFRKCGELKVYDPQLLLRKQKDEGIN